MNLSSSVTSVEVCLYSKVSRDANALFFFFFPSPDSVRGDKIPEEAVVDEEAILSLLENSQTFLPLAQTSNHSPLLGMMATRRNVIQIH